MSKAIFLTGSPGIGKTTVLMKAVEALKNNGYRVGGMISSEIRIAGSRVGFEVTDLLRRRRDNIIPLRLLLSEELISGGRTLVRGSSIV